VIAVTGATGGVGGRVAARLARRGAEQLLVVRDASRAPQIDGAEVRTIAGYGDRFGMRRALDGADTLLLVPASESPDRVAHHETAVDAAVAAGVRRIVYLSFLNAAPDATFTFARHHWDTEQHIRATGLAFTFLRMSLHLDFLPTMVGSDGLLAGPADDGRVAPVARDDLADVAAVALTDEGHDGATYDVTGGEAFTLAEAAREMSRLAGRPIVFRDETLDEAFDSRARFGAPHWEVEGWVTSYAAIAAGELDVVAPTVQRLAGHDPLTLAQLVRAHPESLAHVGSTI
jgi:NAD(P)H dehydrogenase (quinone)